MVMVKTGKGLGEGTELADFRHSLDSTSLRCFNNCGFRCRRRSAVVVLNSGYR